MIRTVHCLVHVVKVAGILVRHSRDGVDDGDVDANSLTNGESLYHPTPGPRSPIFPHSPDHQSVTHISPHHPPTENPHRPQPNTGNCVLSPSDLFIIF